MTAVEESFARGSKRILESQIGTISETQGIILKDQRILIPLVLRRKILDKLHQGHQGIEKTKQRARQSVF